MIISYFVCANMSAVIENYNTERLKVTLKIMLMSYLNFAENIPLFILEKKHVSNKI